MERRLSLPLTQSPEVALAKFAQTLENPALDGKVKGIEALEDPGNADLLNFRSGNAAAGRGAGVPDEAEVKRAVASAL